MSATTAKAIVAKIRSGDLKSEFRSHEVWRPGWSKLTDSDDVRVALEMLVDYDWLRVRKVETAGRPAFDYIVNPKTLNGLKGCHFAHCKNCKNFPNTFLRFLQ